MDNLVFSLLLPFLQPVLLGGASFDVTLTTLDPKVTPFTVEADDDPKDIKLRKRARFVPSKQADDDLKKRFVFQAKRDGAGARLVFGRSLVGDVRGWTRVAVDDLEGLAGASDEGLFAWLFEAGCVPTGGAEGAGGLRATATWNEAIAGLSAGARLDGTPVGATVDFPGQKEIFLVVERVGGVDAVYAAAAVSDQHDGYGALQLLHQVAGEGDPGPVSMDIGVEGLGKKGRVYVAQTSFRVTPSLVAGTSPEETLFGMTLFEAFDAVDTVDTALFFPFEGFDPLLAELQRARDAIDDLFAQLDGGARGIAGLDPSIPVDKIGKQLVRASKAVDQAIAKAQKLQAADATSAQPLKGVVNRAQKGTRIAAALLLGFQTQSLGKLDRTVDY